MMRLPHSDSLHTALAAYESSIDLSIDFSTDRPLSSMFNPPQKAVAVAATAANNPS